MVDVGLRGDDPFRVAYTTGDNEDDDDLWEIVVICELTVEGAATVEVTVETILSIGFNEIVLSIIPILLDTAPVLCIKLIDKIGAIAFIITGSSILFGKTGAVCVGWFDLEAIETPIIFITELDGKTGDTAGKIIFLILSKVVLTALSIVVILFMWLLTKFVYSYWFLEILFYKSIFFKEASTEQ